MRTSTCITSPAPESAGPRLKGGGFDPSPHRTAPHLPASISSKKRGLPHAALLCFHFHPPHPLTPCSVASKRRLQRRQVPRSLTAPHPQDNPALASTPAAAPLTPAPNVGAGRVDAMARDLVPVAVRRGRRVSAYTSRRNPGSSPHRSKFTVDRLASLCQG